MIDQDLCIGCKHVPDTLPLYAEPHTVESRVAESRKSATCVWTRPIWMKKAVPGVLRPVSKVCPVNAITFTNRNARSGHRESSYIVNLRGRALVETRNDHQVRMSYDILWLRR